MVMVALSPSSTVSSSVTTLSSGVAAMGNMLMETLLTPPVSSL